MTVSNTVSKYSKQTLTKDLHDDIDPKCKHHLEHFIFKIGKAIIGGSIKI